MSAARFERLAALFREAMRLEGAARDRLLSDATRDDPGLRREIDALIDQESRLPAALRDEELARRASCRAARLLDDVERSVGADRVAGFAEPGATPREIGGYEILGRLGSGGMGVVYRARQPSPSRMVALKVMQSLSTAPGPLRRFRQEGELLGRLRHAGIAQIYEAGVHESPGGAVPFIAMELVEGEPITSFARSHALTLAQRVELVVRVCDAVDHAHRHGVVHRDLKPANILVEDDGACGRPRIVDFGIARDGSTLAAGETRAVTLTGQIVGTLRSMSPEQARGGSITIDARSDVYSLGAILFELVAGRPPLLVDDLPLDEALGAIRNSDPPSLGSLDRRARGDLETIVMKALAKDPERRYASAGDFAADLQRHLDGEPIRAHPPSALHRARTFARRNRTLVGAMAAIAVVSLAATVVSAGMAWRARDARLRAERLFEDANRLAQTLLFDLDDALVAVPGTIPARRILVERGLHYLDRLANDEVHGEALRATNAAGYLKIGDLQGGSQRPNIGDLPAALASYARAIELLESLREGAAGAQARTLLTAHARRGDVLRQLGRHEEALAAYGRSLELAQRRASAVAEGDLAVLRDLAAAHERIADTLGVVGRGEEARTEMERADAVTNELFARHPESPEARRDRAVSLFKSAIRKERSNPAAALSELQEYLGMVRELAAADPHHAIYRRDLAIGHQRLGNALVALGRSDEAIAAYEQELRYVESLATADPSNFRALADLASPSCKLGELHLARRDLSEARRHFDRLLAAAERCVAIDPSAVDAQRELGVAYYKLFEWHRAAAQDESARAEERASARGAARDWLARALEHFRDLSASGALSGSDAGVPGDLEKELAELDRERAQGGS